jgi:hypothetical protein
MVFVRGRITLVNAARGKEGLMFGLGNRLAGRVSAIQRKVAVRKRTPGRASFKDLSQRLTDARRQVAQGRRGR